MLDKFVETIGDTVEKFSETELSSRALLIRLNSAVFGGFNACLLLCDKLIDHSFGFLIVGGNLRDSSLGGLLLRLVMLIDIIEGAIEIEGLNRLDFEGEAGGDEDAECSKSFHFNLFVSYIFSING